MPSKIQSISLKIKRGAPLRVTHDLRRERRSQWHRQSCLCSCDLGLVRVDPPRELAQSNHRTLTTRPRPLSAGFYSTMKPSRNRRNPLKTKNRCTVYSTMKSGGYRGRFSPITIHESLLAIFACQRGQLPLSTPRATRFAVRRAARLLWCCGSRVRRFRRSTIQKVERRGSAA